LSAFEKRGGKLIIEAGSADPCVPYHATLDYYERVTEYFGSLEKVSAFCRFYIVPGMNHGWDGPGINQHPDLLSHLVDWREKGTAPGQLCGRRVVNGKTELEMPLFPYPARTGWDAQAASFQQVEGPRGGVERIAERFRPIAAE